MSISFSLPTFPVAASLLNAVKLPWGCVIKPFSLPATNQQIGDAAEVPRCESCFGYLNPSCSFRKNNWQCSICKEYNRAPERYHDAEKRKTLPELSNAIIDLRLDEDPGTLAYVALIDENGDQAYFDAVKGSILAAMEALPDDTLIGLMTYSSQLGIFNLHSSTPAITHVPVADDPLEGTIEVGLEDVTSLEQFFVQKAENIRNITAAIEALPLLMHDGSDSIISSKFSTSSNSVLEPPTVGGGTNDSVIGATPESDRRAFGSAVKALVDLLLGGASNKLINCKAMCFVNGAPNLGIGSIPRADASTTSVNTTPSIPFYYEQAKRAATAGISMDLVITASGAVGLSNVRYLATLTGGTVQMYEPTRWPSLPQDTFKKLSRGLAFRGLLRLRTATEFSLKDHYGHMLADDQHENLYHVAGADEWSVCAFEYQWGVAERFEIESTFTTLQLAYAFTLYPPRGSSLKVNRILRLLTVTPPITTNITDLYRAADLNSITFLLTQKVIGFADELNRDSALNALNDWLANVVRLYDRNLSENASNSQVADINFSKLANLQLLPKVVFGLEKSVLFNKETHPDLWVSTICTWAVLEPKLLRKSIYAELMSFKANSFELSAQNIPLSVHAIAASGESVFLLDTCQSIVIFCTAAAAAANVQFPPPKESAIRVQMNNRKAECFFTPTTAITREGNPDQVLFTVALIEDALGSTMSYSQFCETIHSKVSKLKSKA